MTSAFSWQNSVSLLSASFCTPRPNLAVTPDISWLRTFAFQSPMIKTDIFFLVLFLGDLVGLLMCVWSRSVVSDSATLWTVAHQAPLSMGFSRQEYWSGVPFLSPGDLSDPGIEPRSPALQADSLPSELLGKPWGNSQPITSRKMGTSVLKPEGNEFLQQSVSLERMLNQPCPPTLSKRTEALTESFWPRDLT